MRLCPAFALSLAISAGCAGSSPPPQRSSSLGDLADESQAALARGAEQREARACFGLARRYREGIGVIKSDQTAYGWLKLSCELNVVLGCNQAGWAALHGRGTVRDPAAAG